MSQSMEDIFLKNLPSGLKTNDLVVEYVTAVGEVFEEIREEINQKSYEGDYALSLSGKLEDLMSNYGIYLNPKIKADIIRRIIRDAPDIFSRLGTRKTLDWALKTLGYRSFEIDEVWVPNPDLVRRGYFRELLSNEEPRRYDIRKSSYTDFVVGREYVNAQGTFFEGFVYNDFEKQEPINGIPIYGETYTTYTGLTFKDMVSKTPYLLVRIFTPPDYDEVISDVDPVTGDPVFIDIFEKQSIVIESIRYLIQTLQRTATTKIILVTDLLIFTDIIPRVRSNLNFNFTSVPLESVDAMPNFSEDVYDGNMRIKQNAPTLSLQTIGNNRPIGIDAPYQALGEYTTPGRIGAINSNDRNVLDGVRGVDVVIPIVQPIANLDYFVYLDYAALVNFTVPSGTSVTIQQMRNAKFGTNRVTVGTYSAGQTFNQTIVDSHALVLRFSSSSQETIDVTITYP